jgi:hypothetical protein
MIKIAYARRQERNVNNGLWYFVAIIQGEMGHEMRTIELRPLLPTRVLVPSNSDLLQENK